MVLSNELYKNLCEEEYQKESGFHTCRNLLFSNSEYNIFTNGLFNMNRLSISSDTLPEL